MTIEQGRLREAIRVFGRRHIAYHMARELLEIYGNAPVPVWNYANEVLPPCNGQYLIQTSYGERVTAYYDVDSDEWRSSTGDKVRASHWMDLPPVAKGRNDG